MARPTLKLPKPAAGSALGKPSTLRGRLAQRARHAAVAPEASPPAPASPRSKPDASPPRAARTKPTAGPAETRPPHAGPKRPPRRKEAGASEPPRSGKPKPFAVSRARPPKAPDARTARGEHARAQQAAPRAPAPRTPPRPGAHDNPGDPRLSKLMSERGLCSRREADEWIENGWVKVDGKAVTQLGVRVPREARIDIDPAAAKHQGEQVTIVLHKPVGYVSGQPEDGYQSAVVLVKPENRWAEDPSPIKFRPGHLRGLAPAGRLDIDSTGLLVYTQDGRVARRLIGADSEVEKEYLVRVEGKLPDEAMALLRHGLELDGVKLKPAKVSWANEDQLRFVLREGRKRQIRRMCESVGLVVVGLKRVRSGGVPLGALPVGQWRYLRRDEKF